jgi:predicted sulfurtransferase
MRRRVIIAALAVFALAGGAAWAQADGGQTPSDRITVEEFRKLLADKKAVVVLDVRGEIESKIKGAKHIPVGDLEARLKELPEGSEVVTYCA